ncbi:MAG: DMT family transporter [Candidatus Hodarchaeales archaeon]
MSGNKTISVDYLIAVIQALFVTVLWSSSWVIIKFGLEDIPPVIFSGLRYTSASFILLFAIFIKEENRKQVFNLSRMKWIELIVYGIIFISLTQGAMFIALDLLPAITVSLMLNFTICVVIVLSAILLKEKPSVLQVTLIMFGLIGALMYFYPINIPFSELIGLIVISVGVLANALASILGRSINRAKNFPPLLITGLSMAFGSAALLAFGLLFEGVPHLSAISIVYILWLSIVNTAFAFTLWNKTMQKLRAVDSTLINSTMLPQITFLAIIFLGEYPTPLELVGLIILAVSILLVQLNQAKQENAKEKSTSA